MVATADIMEFIMAVFAMTGAFLLSKLMVKEAMLTFITGNFAGAYVAISAGLPGLLTQMLFFITTGVIVLWSLKKELMQDKKTLFYFIPVIFVAGIALTVSIKIPSVYQNSLESSYFEIIAASFAILGSFLMKYEDKIKRYGFICFIIADILYIEVAVSNELWFFLVQSIFFVWTSSNGLKNLKKEVLNAAV